MDIYDEKIQKIFNSKNSVRIPSFKSIENTIKNNLYNKYRKENKYIFFKLIAGVFMNKKNCHICSVFKEQMLSSNIKEYMKRKYSRQDFLKRFQRYYVYYKPYFNFFSRPYFTDFYYNILIKKSNEKKARLFYNKNLINQKNETDSIKDEGILIYSKSGEEDEKNNKYNNIIFFNNTIINKIENNSSFKESTIFDKNEVECKNDDNFLLIPNSNEDSLLCLMKKFDKKITKSYNKINHEDNDLKINVKNEQKQDRYCNIPNENYRTIEYQNNKSIKNINNNILNCSKNIKNIKIIKAKKILSSNNNNFIEYNNNKKLNYNNIKNKTINYNNINKLILNKTILLKSKYARNFDNKINRYNSIDYNYYFDESNLNYRKTIIFNLKYNNVYNNNIFLKKVKNNNNKLNENNKYLSYKIIKKIINTKINKLNNSNIKNEKKYILKKISESKNNKNNNKYNSLKEINTIQIIDKRINKNLKEKKDFSKNNFNNYINNIPIYKIINNFKINNNLIKSNIKLKKNIKINNKSLTMI